MTLFIKVCFVERRLKSKRVLGDGLLQKFSLQIAIIKSCVSPRYNAVSLRLNRR